MNESEYEMSPQDIAKKIFTEEPKKPLTNVIGVENSPDMSFVYEILLNILLEGLDLVTEDLNNYDYDNFNEKSILFFNPWFYSMGFTICVKKYHKSEIDKYKDYYCKTITKNKEYENYFIMKNLNNNYHFMINPKYMNSCNKKTLEEFHTVFQVNNDIYKIWFTDYVGES